MMKNEDSILLASGGMDSTTLAYWLVSQDINYVPVFLDYGQHCRNTELETLREVLPNKSIEKLVIIDISDIYLGSSSRLIKEPNLWVDEVSASDYYLPYRNLLFLSVGASYALSHGYSNIYTAFINSNHAKEIDCSSKFFNDLNNLLSEYGTIRVLMPFKDISKYEVAKLGLSLNVPIGRTFSCQSSSKIPCGACPNCVDRIEAINKLFP